MVLIVAKETEGTHHLLCPHDGTALSGKERRSARQWLRGHCKALAVLSSGAHGNEKEVTPRIEYFHNCPFIANFKVEISSGETLPVLYLLNGW